MKISQYLTNVIDASQNVVSLILIRPDSSLILQREFDFFAHKGFLRVSLLTLLDLYSREQATQILLASTVPASAHGSLFDVNCLPQSSLVPSTCGFVLSSEITLLQHLSRRADLEFCFCFENVREDEMGYHMLILNFPYILSV